MALGTFRPGPYTATLNSVALGIMSGDGAKLKFRPGRIPINNTSAYGDTLIDGIYRGVASCQLLVTFKEWNAAVQAAIWPWPSTPAHDGTIGVIGALQSAQAKVLVLTAVASTPAAANSPGTIFTAGLALLAPENDVEVLFGPVETDVPVLFDLFLYDDSGTKRLFKWSS